jgi:hypothetical protein
LSDDFDDPKDNQRDEVLIPSEQPENTEKLPEPLLKTYDRGEGKLLIAGQICWDMVGKKDTKGVAKVRPNLWSFHRFTDETVSREINVIVQHFIISLFFLIVPLHR